MNLSGKPKRFELKDIEETNGEPVAVDITPLTPAEVDEMAVARGGIDFNAVAKLYRAAKKQGISLADFTSASEGTDEDKIEKMAILLEESGAELPDISVKKRTATETHKILESHIVGWSGIVDDNQKPVVYSIQSKERLLVALPAIVKDQIVDAVEHLTEYGVLPGEDTSSPN